MSTSRPRYDERDNVQARGALVPGTPEYDEYYGRHPERRRRDDATRALPGLGRVGGPLDLPLPGSEHDLLVRLSREDVVDGPPDPADVCSHAGKTRGDPARTCGSPSSPSRSPRTSAPRATRHAPT